MLEGIPKEPKTKTAKNRVTGAMNRIFQAQKILKVLLPKLDEKEVNQVIGALETSTQETKKFVKAQMESPSIFEFGTQEEGDES